MLSRIVLAVVAAAALANAAAAQPRQASRTEPIFRHADVDAAWQASQKSRRPVLVYVTSSNCHYCKKMLSETLAHPQIARANNHYFETAAVSHDDHPELVERLGVKAFPTTLLVRPDGSLAARLQGYVKPEKFAEKLFAPPKERQAAKKDPGVRG